LVNMGVIHQWEIFFYKLWGLVYIWRPRGNDAEGLINTLGRKEGLTIWLHFDGEWAIPRGDPADLYWCPAREDSGHGCEDADRNRSVL
jgi:hypothetical protein